MMSTPRTRTLLLSLLTVAACGVPNDLIPIPGVDSTGPGSTGSTGSTPDLGDSTGIDSTGGASSTGDSTGGSTGGSGSGSTGMSSSGGEGSDSTGAEGSGSTGEPAPVGCFGAQCSDEIPCGKGLVCLMHPVEGISRCALADCIPGEPCSGDEYTCGDPLLGAPLGECLANGSGHGWCHPRTCKDGACDVGACVDGLCY